MFHIFGIFFFFMSILLSTKKKGSCFVKIFYHQNYGNTAPIEEEYSTVSLKDSIEKTRLALEIAYAGFDNALETDLIDSYIYQINSLQKRYEHLTELAAAEPVTESGYSNQHSPIRALVSHVFG